MICVVGTDWSIAPLPLREELAVRAGDILQDCRALPGVRGTVLLQTCNRFELYADTAEDIDLAQLAGGAFGQAPALLDNAPRHLFQLSGEAAHRRLLQVACGLRSQILGEEQILTQVKEAIAAAREAGSGTPELETLFRLAVTAGKEGRARVRLRAAPSSSAGRAVSLAQEQLGSLRGRRALVVGNGEMGRLTAALLVREGCSVTVTLRSYRHGETVVPQGCHTVPYHLRQEALEGCDLLISATRSPHHTVSADMLRALAHPPRVLIDMAMPRDVDPACGDLGGVALFDLDHLRDEIGETGEHNRAQIGQIQEIIDKRLADYAKWRQGRQRCRHSPSRRIAVFAGTTEGRLLCRHLAAAGVPATAFVATAYGRAALPPMEHIAVRAGRLDREEMAEALGGQEIVVDATHPYAVQASTAIRAGAERAGARYLRLLRSPTNVGDDVVSVPDAQSAAAYLAGTDGPILLTTGSKELEAYTAIPGFAQRIHPRVLPDPGVVERCLGLGFAPGNLICMQGPFSHQLNLALLRAVQARWLITKDGGSEGGLPQKLSAARAAGAGVLLIARPEEEGGYTLAQIQRLLTGYAAPPPPKGNARFPLFVDLTGVPCLVVGGGGVGARRIRRLAEFGARVTAVAPHFQSRIEGVDYRERPFRPGDTRGMRLAVAATDHRPTNRAVALECREAGIPVSVADAPEESTFFFPALCHSSNLSAGVVSHSGAHALTAQGAAAVRAVLEELDP